MWVVLRHLLSRLCKSQVEEERTAAAGENAQAGQLLASRTGHKAQGQSVDADSAQPEQLTDASAATYDSEEERRRDRKSEGRGLRQLSTIWPPVPLEHGS